MVDRSTQDYLKVGTYKVRLFGTSVRRAKKNELISFVEPLLSGDNIKSSMYNLNRIKTVFQVKAYVRNEAIDYNGFSANVDTTPTIDSLMASTAAITFGWRDSTVTGYITSFNIIEDMNTYHTMQQNQITTSTYTFNELTLIEFTLEVGTAI